PAATGSRAKGQRPSLRRARAVHHDGRARVRPCRPWRACDATRLRRACRAFGQRRRVPPRRGPVGEPVDQIPMGVLGDFVSRRGLLMVMAIAALGTAIGLGFTLSFFGVRTGMLFVMGGALFAVYSLSLTLLGERFQGSRLAEANAAFVFIYGIGALI